MPSRGQALIVLLVMAVAVVLIVSAFVFPGFAVTACSRDVEPSTDPGHWFCSVTVTLPRPACGENTTVANGSTVVTNFDGKIFVANLFWKCWGAYNNGLNVSILQAPGGPYHVTHWSGGFAIWNWTAPDNQSGLSWMSPYTLELLVAG